MATHGGTLTAWTPLADALFPLLHLSGRYFPLGTSGQAAKAPKTTCA